MRTDAVVIKDDHHSSFLGGHVVLDQNRSPGLYRYTLVGKHILEHIESGALKPGERIPSLRQMSSRMRVSVTTVLQAYIELESQGVIESRPKSGFFVRSNFRELLPPPAAEPNPAMEPREVNRSELIRTVWDLLGRTDVLPFGVACPDKSLLPGRELGRIMATVVREEPDRAMGYECVSGNPELRKQIALRCMDTGASVMPDDIIVTTGAMEGISIIMRCLTRPGDIVIIQSPAFYCFLELLDMLGLRVIEIPSHPDFGISPADVASVINQYDVKACILNPNFNNPDGSLIPDEAKEEIVKLLARKSIPLIEDDVSGDLHFGPSRPQVCKKYDKKGLVILCSSFSKTISPGYRVGWLAPGRFHEKAQAIKVTTSVCSASPTQMAVAEFLRTGKYDRHLKKLRGAIETQMQALRLAVSRYFPSGTKVTRPSGGAVLWIELPHRVDSREYFFQAKANGIGVVPGLIFSTRDKFQSFVRLTCSGVWTRETEKGIETLGALAANMVSARTD
jgi:DNA-binding transcriptional MocR family regulator